MTKQCRSQNDERTGRAYFCISSFFTFQHSSSSLPFRFAKSWRKSNAVPSLPSRSFELPVSSSALLEPPSVENASSHALPCGTYRCFSESLSSKLHHPLRHSLLQRWF